MYLGFDRNDYPGDVVLDALRHTFAFCGYWLNAPPGESATNWTGKREILRAHGFGFLVLFNGRLDKQLTSTRNPKLIGAEDAQAAVKAAQADGFARGTVIFVDQEEGGRMLPEQQEYLLAWIDGVNAAGYCAGVYCSGMPDKSGAGGVITANDIREHAGGRQISFFVYNDSCPPSPGCIYSAKNITPAQGGVPFATIWQIAQSPQRKSLTRKCAATYAADGNCYPPGLAVQGIFVDVDISASADPSHGR
ncbi:MAG TPA: glycoside hydrolase domain-containing protein [Candidatus Acidoferrales bacterium]|nr:glycoside hydrolase domain-containing protein [Candidatus Acidoferrales bacterium]